MMKRHNTNTPAHRFAYNVISIATPTLYLGMLIAWFMVATN